MCNLEYELNSHFGLTVIELKEGVKLYHGRSYPILKIHEQAFRLEVERLVKNGVLKRVNRSTWGAPTFIIPKSDKTIWFISDFRELNKCINRQSFPLLKSKSYC